MTHETIKHLLCYGEASALAFSSDGRLLAACDITKLTLWNVSTWKPEHVFHLNDMPRSVSFSKYNHLMAVGTVDRMKVKIWNTQSWKLLKNYSGHSQEVTSVSLDDKGQLVASCSGSERLIVWDIKKNRRVFSFDESEDIIDSAVLSPDGTLVACVVGQQIMIWETTHWNLVHKINHWPDYFECVKFSPDGTLLACSCGNTSAVILLVQCHSWKVKSTLRGYTSRIQRLAFSHDGKILASAQMGRSEIKLWNTETGSSCGSFADTGIPHTDLAFHPTRNLIAAASNDGSGRVSVSRINL